MFGELVLGIKQ